MKKNTGIREEPFIGTFSSFSEKHTESIRSIIAHLRNPASAAVVTSENYALQEHYVREIVSNVFGDKESGEVKRAPLDRDSIIKKVNVRLREIDQLDLKAKVRGNTKELWIFELTNSELVSPLSLVHRILSQFKQAGISVLVLTTGIAWRSDEMKKWLRVTRTPLWSFDLPDEEQCADFLQRAEIDGSLQTARELVNKLAVQEEAQDDFAQIVTFDPLALADKVQAEKDTDPVEDKSHSKEKVENSESPLARQKKNTFVGYAALVFLLVAFSTFVLLGDVITPGIESLKNSFTAFFKPQPALLSNEGTTDSQEIVLMGDETGMVLAPKEDVMREEAATVSDQIDANSAKVDASLDESAAMPAAVDVMPDEVISGEVEAVALQKFTRSETLAAGKPMSAAIAPVQESSKEPALDIKLDESVVEATYFLQQAAFRNKNAAFAWVAKNDAVEPFRVGLKKNNYWAVIRGPYTEAKLSRIRSTGGLKDSYVISASDLLN